MKKDKLAHLYRQFSAGNTAPLSQSSKERIKGQVLQSIRTVPAHTVKRAHSMHAWSFWLVRFTTAAVLVLAVLSGTAYASGSSLPGDALYTVKRAVEDARLSLASTPESKAKLQVLFTEERIRELDTIETKTPTEKKATKKTVLPTPPPSATALPEASTTITTTMDVKEETSTHSEAEMRARKEVFKALSNLEQTQKSLNNQGKQGEAKNLDATITKLRDKANVRSWRDERKGQKDAESRQENESKKIDANEGSPQDTALPRFKK